MIKKLAVIGDSTNMGGLIITASGTCFSGINQVALLGDLASCPKCQSSGKIIEGTENFIIDGKPASYDGCIIACKCYPVGSHKIVATKSSMFVNLSNKDLSKSSPSSLIENKQCLNKKNSDKWISFKLPMNKDYSGLKFVVTLNSGQLLRGTFDENNKAKLSIDTDCHSANIKIENLKDLENDKITSSITEILLEKIIG